MIPRKYFVKFWDNFMNNKSNFFNLLNSTYKDWKKTVVISSLLLLKNKTTNYYIVINLPDHDKIHIFKKIDDEYVDVTSEGLIRTLFYDLPYIENCKIAFTPLTYMLFF